MYTEQMNSPGINNVTKTEVASSFMWPVFMLFSRVLLFALFGLAFILVLYLAGSPKPFEAVIKWWPFQVILANAVCFLLLTRLCKRENKTFLSLIKVDRKQRVGDIKAFLLLLVVSGIIGFFGVYGATLLIYGGTPLINVSQSLPLWALIVAAVLFPASNALMKRQHILGIRMKGLEELVKAGGSF